MKTRAIAILFSLYFVAACWIKSSDPVVIAPKFEGIVVRLYPPFSTYRFGFMAPDHWFGDLADSKTDLCRSPIVIYENDNPLGPIHSPYFNVVTEGKGRSLHWRINDTPDLYGTSAVFYFSSSDNTDPRTNGRAYWAVKTEKVGCR